VLVFGATGDQGGRGRRCPGPGSAARSAPLVRDPAAPAAVTLAAAGTELAAAQFTGSDAVATAMRGTAAAFTLITPFESGAAAEVRQGQAMTGAAVAVRLP
jgi:hypothetical protein